MIPSNFCSITLFTIFKKTAKKLNFRAQPHFGAFWTRDLKRKRYKLETIDYHPWKFEDDILSRSGEDLWTKWHSLNQKIVNTSDQKWRHHTKNYFKSFYTKIHHPWNFMKILSGVFEKSSKKKTYLRKRNRRITIRSSVFNGRA